jgi:hypothetical protein
MVGTGISGQRVTHVRDAHLAVRIGQYLSLNQQKGLMVLFVLLLRSTLQTFATLRRFTSAR